MADTVTLPEITVSVGATPGTDGVPALAGDVSVGLQGDLLTADASELFGFLSSQWGVFQNGAPVILFDTFVSIDYRRDWAISDYPVEEGGFESYNKVYIPYDARVKFASGGSEANRAALLANVDAVSQTLLLYDVVTPEKVYQSVNVRHYNYMRTATNGVGIITVEMWLLEVRVTVSESSTTTAGTTPTDGATAGAGAPAADYPPVGGPENYSPQDTSGAVPNNDGFVSPSDSGAPSIYNTDGIPSYDPFTPPNDVPTVTTLGGAVINGYNSPESAGGIGP
jgi:hypothetical protein